jgi:hypothetical protein
MSSSPCLHVSQCFQNSANKKPELTENRNFRLFAANTKGKRQTSICLLQMETENWKFVFIGRQTINSNRRLLFQQTCPSLEISRKATCWRHRKTQDTGQKMTTSQRKEITLGIQHEYLSLLFGTLLKTACGLSFYIGSLTIFCLLPSLRFVFGTFSCRKIHERYQQARW